MTKDFVLSLLKNEKDYLSGEVISRRAGVSRSAVNEAIRSLRKDGYQIEAVTNRGYLLKGSPDLLSPGELLAGLSGERMKNVRFYESTDSTNLRIRDMADRGAPSGMTAVANEQTAGRGRMGRSFLSLKDKGLYLSYLLRPECPPEEIVSITAWAAVASARAVYSVCGCRPNIKWVNDLMMGGRKICGILSEMMLESESGLIRYVVIGIGFNINEEAQDFPEDLRSKAGSIAMACSRTFSRSAFACALIRELDAMKEAWPSEKAAYLEEYRRLCATSGRRIRVITPRSEREADALEVNEDFSLKVRYDDGTVEDLKSGEVSTAF